MLVLTQLYPTLCDPMDCSPPDSSVHDIFQARILEWIAISSSFLFSAGNLIFTSVMKKNNISSYHPVNQPTYMCPHILCFCFWCGRGIILFSCLRLISLVPWSPPSWPPIIVPYCSSIIKMLPSLLDYSFFLLFFGPHPAACGILVPCPGIEPRP